MRRASGTTGRRHTFTGIVARVLILALCAQILAATLPGLQRPARAEDMLLENEYHFGSSAYGWLFFGLSIVAVGVAVNDYNETEYNVKKAKQAYANYQAAGPGTVLMWRDQTLTYAHRAEAYESSTNAAGALSLAFLVTAIVIWRNGGSDSSSPMLLSDRGVGWSYKF